MMHPTYAKILSEVKASSGMNDVLAQLIWDVNESLAALAVSKAIAESRRFCKAHGIVLDGEVVVQRVRAAAEQELVAHDRPRTRTRQVFGSRRQVQNTDWQLHVDRVLWIHYKVLPRKNPDFGNRTAQLLENL